MKINFLFLFVSITIIAFESSNIERIGGTELNGNGCVCHTTVESSNVHVWIEGPDTMVAGTSAIYKMYMFGGPAIAGGYNVAVRFGLLNLADTISLLIDNELTQGPPLPFSATTDTIFWQFLYTAPDSVEFDTLYSVGLSTNWDSIPDDRDQWAYGPKFSVRIVENTVPVELLSLTGRRENLRNILLWETASEKNNRGFEVERIAGSQGNRNQHSNSEVWQKIGFVNGKGTSTVKNYYSFYDNDYLSGITEYRLKQIDFDGNFTYSEVITIEREDAAKSFSLAQNFPNPFNPSTKISWGSSVSGWQTLKIYDELGNEIATLIDEIKSAGNYEMEFDASQIRNLASGIYFYQLTIGEFKQTKKMIYLR